MENGYIKLWRKSLDSGLIQDHKTWVFWCWCLMKATWKPRKTLINHIMVSLQPGQFIFGREAAAKELNMSVQEIRTRVIQLVKYGNLTIKSTNRFSVITIINWDTYQPEENRINQQINQQLTSSQPAANHKQEGKKERREEKEKIYKKESWNFESALAEKGVADSFIRDWMKVRKTKKATNTQTAFNRLAKEVEKSGMSWNTVIEHCCSNDWKGFKAEWVENNNFTRKKGLVI